MVSLLNLLHTNYNDITRMTLFNFLKTGNPAYDAILSTICISVFGFMLNYIYEHGIHPFLTNFSCDDFTNLFYRKNMIIIDGKKNYITSSFTFTCCESSVYSNRFKALWNYIILNIETNKTIFSIKETHTNFQSSENNQNTRYKTSDMFIVNQTKCFQIDEDIFVKVEIDKEDNSSDDRGNVKSKTEKTTIYLYSYKYNVSYLKNYLDNITEKYLDSVKDNRINKKFTYFLDKVKHNNEESILNCWKEHKFDSARTFDNMFFDGKKELISKIDFFLNNREWYYKTGIPYSLGIGLHGPPGTGKTSFIKALANYTGRHIVMISLKLIKTKSQLENFFFENRYNEDNEQNSITFDKKIIVFEDIDCVGDIVLNRNKNSENKKNKFKKNNVNVSDVIQSICQINETNATTEKKLLETDEQITLDDILNIWDGVRETPGRIMVISSNHYDKLDPALVREGRIDITHELSNASHNVISELYLHLFNKEINKTKLEKIKECFYSPAELINIYIATGRNADNFVKRLLENKKNKK